MGYRVSELWRFRARNLRPLHIFYFDTLIPQENAGFVSIIHRSLTHSLLPLSTLVQTFCIQDHRHPLLCTHRIMHQEHSDHLTKHDFSPTSSYSTHHHQSMSTESFSPIIHSTSSFSTDDTYQSSPVKDTDEIVRRNYYSGDPVGSGYDDQDGTSLWHDLDRDGVNTPAIPSFILNSPPMGPMMGGKEECPEMMVLHKQLRGHPENTSHSLRKGFFLFILDQRLIVGRDPKFFFGEAVGENGLKAEGTTYIPEPDLSSTDPTLEQGQYCFSHGYCSNTPSPSASNNTSSLWPTDNISSQKYFPSQGPWGIIPSRSVMITNLPKTTQLWTLVELLKVPPPLLFPSDNEF